MSFWRRRAYTVLAGFAALVLSACGSVPPTRLAVEDGLDRYALDARFALRDGREKGQNFSGRLHWQHSVSGDRVFVQDPFGGGVAELTDSGSGARMVLSSGEISEAVDAPQLMEALTGVALPVRKVARWLTGRALPLQGVARDALGRPSSFESEGWKISYDYESSEAADADMLPARVFAAHGQGIELRLAIETWNLNGKGSNESDNEGSKESGKERGKVLGKEQ